MNATRTYSADADPAQVIDLLQLIDGTVCWKPRPPGRFRSADPAKTAEGWNAMFAGQPARVHRGRINIDGALTPVGQVLSILGAPRKQKSSRPSATQPGMIEPHHLPESHMARTEFVVSLRDIFEVRTEAAHRGEIWVKALSNQVYTPDPLARRRHKVIDPDYYKTRGGRDSTAMRREKREHWEAYVWPPISKVCWEHGIPHANRSQRNRTAFPAMVGGDGSVDVIGLFRIRATLLREIMVEKPIVYSTGKTYDFTRNEWVPRDCVIPPEEVHFRRTLSPETPFMSRAEREARAAGAVRTSLDEGAALRKKHPGEDVPRYIRLQDRIKAAIPRVLEVDEGGRILYRTLTLGDWLWLEMNGHLLLDDRTPLDPAEWVKNWNSTRAGGIFLQADWRSGAYVLDFPTIHYRETRRILQPRLKP